ncbi:MAG: hypothetical protein WCK63_01780 [Betaproteobacteria bacterium]
MNLKQLAISCTLASAILSGCASMVPVSTQTPNNSAPPYLIGKNGWTTTALLTVGEGTENYKMTGIPDGLGAYLNEKNELVVLMNHELGSNSGAVHAHGDKGAFVSKWRFDPATLQVLGGRDLIRNPILKTGSKAFGRFCSADLPAVTAFYNPVSGLGTQNRIFMNGEENGPNGRAFAHVATGPEAGTSYELTKMLQASWENIVANPLAQDQTVVIGLDDTHPKANAKSKHDKDAGKLYVYIGTKQKNGNEIEKAGLSNGQTFNIQVAQSGLENRLTPLSGRFDLVSEGGTNFLRPEDGAWDPKNPNVFYFLTTDRMTTVKDADGDGRSRLYRLAFDDIRNPMAGGRIEALLMGTEGYEMLDNLTVFGNGHLILQEDVGNNPRLGKVWQFDPSSNTLSEIAEHDPARFAKGSAGFLTEDEESSGVIDVTDLLAKAHPRFADGRHYFLLTDQAHFATTPELVEGGQLLLLASPASTKQSSVKALH